MMDILISLAIVCGVVYLIILGYMLTKKTKLIYAPHKPLEKEVAAEKITIENEKKTLNGWVLNPEKKDAVIYFGAKGESVGENIQHLRDMLPDHAVYTFEYRGFGESDGKPREKKIYKDALKIFDTIAEKHGEISVIGRSLGTGIATYVASERQVQKLVLTTPFDSLLNIARSRYPMFPIKIVVRDKFDSVSRADKITAPTLVLMSEIDESVPHKFTERLIIALNNTNVDVSIIGKTNHLNIYESDDYKDFVRNWLSSQKG